MEITLFIVAVVIGLVGLVFSSDKFVEGASSIALHMKVSPLFVGVVLVGIGTSAPEILVSVQSALNDKPELSLGNAIGSNIANIALILGITAMYTPIVVKWKLVKKEFAMLVGVTLLGALFIFDGKLVRFEAIMFLIALGFVLYFLMNGAKTESNSDVQEKPSVSKPKSWVLTVVGMIALIGFSKLLVYGAVGIATFLGMSELMIGLTIVAIGTSLPELSASIAAARKGMADLALGNVIGSNIFNILAVLSVSTLITPFDVPPEALSRDLPLMILLTFVIILMAFSFNKNKDGTIRRMEGGVLLVIFFSYMGLLILESLNLFNVTAFLFKL
jgi:cation:H+ antiporter